MNRETALTMIRDAAPELRERYGVIGVRLFGSMARGDDDQYSDIDVAVQFEEIPYDVHKLLGVTGLLSGVCGVDVDVVAEPARNPELRAAIERDAVRAF